MSVKEPAWLKRTRPCPFFSQGRCLFADSCNFLHDVKVRHALDYPLHNTRLAKQPSASPKPVSDPPSVVVNLASSGPVQNSSRYSGLLSVLSDVIGPSSNLHASLKDASPAIASGCNTSHGPTGLPSEPDLVLSDSESTSTVAHIEGSSSHAEPSSIVEDDPEDILVDPSACLMDSFLPEEDDDIVAEFLPVPDAADAVDGDFAEHTVRHAPESVIGEDKDTNDQEENFTMALSHRQSTLSSFTGASLLASPRSSFFGPSSAPSLIEDGAMNLLSPVQLSAKLRPFSIPSSGSNPKRGDSIDSGYADGQNWVGPLPFPHTPPRSFRSSATFLSHSRQASHSSPVRCARGVSHGVPNPSLHNHIEGIQEVECGSSEHVLHDNVDTAYTILDAYHSSPSEEQGEKSAHVLCQVNVTEPKVEVEVSAVMRNPQRHSPECPYPTSEGDLDSCHPPSFVPDGNLSFKTALSAHPSDEDLSDTSKVSPTKQDSLLAYISGHSTPDTSVFSYCSDVKESLGHPTVGSNMYGSGDAFVAGSDRFTERLSFPFPPPISPDEFVGHSTAVDDEDASELSGATVESLEGVSDACTVSRQEEVQWMCPGSDLMETVRPSQLPLVQSPNSDTNIMSRRCRAASDLTVKRKSPMTTPEGAPCVPVLWSPSLPSEQYGQSDSLQSLYFGDGAPDDGTADDAPCDISNAAEEPSQEYLQSLDLVPHILQRESSLCFDRKPGNSNTDSLRPETVLRPLLTGRRSFLRTSLAELVPKANLHSVKEISSRRPSTRLQSREVGSTIVPLGFRRHRPQPAARIRPSRIAVQPLHAVLPTSQLREVLRIRTDIAQEDLPQKCSSASRACFTARSPVPLQSLSAPPTGGLKELRLPCIINRRSSILSTHSSSIASSILSLDHLFNPSTPQSPSVSSITSFSRNSLLSYSCEQIPEQVHHTLRCSRSNSPIVQATEFPYFAPQSSTRHNLQPVSAPIQRSNSWRLSHYRAGSRNYTPADSTRHLSRRTSTLNLSCIVDEEQELDETSSNMSHHIQSVNESIRPISVFVPPAHAIATPKPTLLFAIASDNVDQVRQVLENGEASPNDPIGPQSALAFTLTNDKLVHKPEIVKALLAYGANPSALRNPTLNPASRIQGIHDPSAPPPETMLEGMDPATRYFVVRADASHTRQTSQLIHRSFFRPLTRVQYDVIGQDWALEQLFRVLSIHSKKLAVAPIVVLLCGPSGHGKSLLARKFGFLLGVPTHTVNMTTVQSAHDIWQSYSMSPYEEPSSCTLAEFLIENEGKRCVVALDEIEKVEDQKALWTLLMPWELGRCSLEAGKRHVDARNVIWLATSNVGHELVFEYNDNRVEPDKRMSREDYLELTGMLRPRVSHSLGPSLVSRITSVLPFVPFTLDERKAIAAEAIYAFAGDTSKTLSPQEVESLVMKALPSYQPSEGARSLHRAISNILIDKV